MFHISLFEKNDGKNGGEDIANRCEKMATRAARTIREEMGDRGEALNQGGVEEGGATRMLDTWRLYRKPRMLTKRKHSKTQAQNGLNKFRVLRGALGFSKSKTIRPTRPMRLMQLTTPMKPMEPMRPMRLMQLTTPMRSMEPMRPNIKEVAVL